MTPFDRGLKPMRSTSYLHLKLCSLTRRIWSSGSVCTCVVLLTCGAVTALAQRAFIWVNYGEEGDHPGFQRVFGGQHADGTKMYVCRLGDNTRIHGSPGKLNQNKCYIPFDGDEMIRDKDFQVLLTNTRYAWKPIFQTSDAEVNRNAVKGGSDLDNAPLFMCRRQLKDGMHLGKYRPSRGVCYIPWGGKELLFSHADGFDVLFP